MIKNSKLIHERRLQQQDQADKHRTKYINLMESLKIFGETNHKLNKALDTEKAFTKKKKNELCQIREILREEIKSRDQFLQTSMLQKKQIGTLEIKHERET